jgi:hypothetical protein
MRVLKIAGKRFGKLTVISRAQNNKTGQSSWYVRCDCGNQKIVTGSKLTTGHTLSCGCLVNEKINNYLATVRLNLIGKTFTNLTVLSRGSNSKYGQTQWLCKCVCGNEVIVSGTALKSGKTKSCGCLRSKHKINLIGKRFGLLVVKAFAYSTPKRTFWKCTCDCGNEIITRGDSLRKEKTLSSGCFQKETATKTGQKKVIDEVGNRYGKLVVLDRTENQSHTKKTAYWLCKCDCGNLTKVRASHLRNGSIVSCGCVKSSGELKIINLLEKNLIEYKTQYSFDDLRGVGNRKLKFDFAIFNNNSLSYLIEYDGEQHSNSKSRYYNQNIVQHDKLKNIYVNKHSIVLIRINKKPSKIRFDDIII